MVLNNMIDQQSNIIEQNRHHNSTEHEWLNDLDEQITQFYFQLVRTNNTEAHEEKLNNILKKLKKDYELNTSQKSHERLCLLYKLIGHTRDIVSGKGEYKLTYMQIFIWYTHFPELAKYALEKMVQMNDSEVCDYSKEEHPYGCWKDIKFFCHYVYKKTTYKKHPLILHSIDIMINRLRNDRELFHKKKTISLAAKWCPREKSKFSWLYKDIVYHAHKHYFDSAKDKDAKFRAYKKASREFRFMLSTLNKYIDTLEIKLCKKEWSNVDFNKVPSMAMYKNYRALMNKKKYDDEIRSLDTDRIECAENFSKHLQKTNTKNNGERETKYNPVKNVSQMKEILSNERYDVMKNKLLSMK